MPFPLLSSVKYSDENLLHIRCKYGKLILRVSSGHKKPFIYIKHNTLAGKVQEFFEKGIDASVQDMLYLSDEMRFRSFFYAQKSLSTDSAIKTKKYFDFEI